MTAYSRILDSIVLPAYDRGRGREYSTRRRFLDRTQWWDREAVVALQWQELERLLTHAFESVPYLQRKYRAAGATRQDIRTWSDFRRLPPLTREEVNAHGPELCSTTYKGRLLPHATGGSSGTPTRFFRTYESYDWRTAAKDRVYEWSGWRLGERSVYLWGAPVGTVSSRQRAKTRAYEALHRQLVINTFSQSEELWNDTFKAIGKFRPVLIVGYVSSLEQFAGFLRQRRLELPPVRAVIAAAEPLFQPARELIAGAFGAPVFNTYGSREFMSIGGECDRHQGLHLNSENVLVETCDMPAQGPSELLVTDLHNYGMPFIRYATGDSAMLSDRVCSCGRGLPMLESIDGRVLDILRTPDGRKIPGEFFPHLFKDIPEFAHYLVEQTRIDHIRISAVLAQPLSDGSRDLLRAEIGKVFGGAMEWEIQVVDALPRLRSGKRRVTVGLAD